MLKLIRKDIIIFTNRWNLLFLLAFTFFILFMAGSPTPTGQFLVIATTFAFFVSTTPFAYEEISNSEFIVQSLPVTKREIVIAKYLGVPFSIFAGIIYSVLVFFLFGAVGLVKIDALRGDIILLIPFIVLLMTSISFPLYFKIGYRRAKIANILVFVSFFMVMNILMTDLEKTKLALLPLLELPGFNFLIPVVAVAITLSSLSISLKLYAGRDL